MSVSMTKRDDCKRFEIIKGVGIQDNLTGRLIMTMRECCNQLNKESDRADKLAEELWDLKWGEKNGINRN